VYILRDIQLESVLIAIVMVILAGCGAQSRVVQLKPATPNEVSNLVKSFEPKCNAPGRVLIRYVQGEGNESWWCIEPARAYRIVSRDLRCPAQMSVKIDFRRHSAVCERSAVRLIYRARSTVAAKVDRASLDRAVEVIRRRVEGLGVVPASIRVEGAHQISVELPDAGNVQAAQEIVGKTAQLYFYDWEPNVVGPSGTTGPHSGALTGGEEPASVGAGLPEYQAVLRAAKRPPILRPNDTTLQRGCTAAQVDGCIYGSWYLLDTKHHEILCPNGETICGPANTRAELHAERYRPSAGAKLKAVHVNPGTVLVQAHPEESNNRIAKSVPNSFYVLNDDPVLRSRLRMKVLGGCSQK
jgi:hypothetical protein